MSEKLERLSDMPKPVKIYDVLKKEKIAEFPSQYEAAKFLGIDPANVSYIIKAKSRNKKNKLGLIITCR